MPRFAQPIRHLAFLPAAGLLAVLAACSSPPRHAHLGDGPPEAHVAPILKTGDASFFDDQLTVALSLSNGLGGRGGPGGPGGRHAGGPPSGGGAGFSGGHGFDGDDADNPGDYYYAMRARQQLGSNLPPLVLQVSLTNHGSADAAVELVDCDSDLGNFAPQPDHFTLTPGQTAGPEPMTSRLGAPNVELPVTITLKLGDRRETHVITLRDAPKTTP